MLKMPLWMSHEFGKKPRDCMMQARRGDFFLKKQTSERIEKTTQNERIIDTLAICMCDERLRITYLSSMHWFLFFFIPFFSLQNKCEQIMCVAPKYSQESIIENHILSKKIKYVYWWNWPHVYDCWWILTEAFRKAGYLWEKISSNIDYCFKKRKDALPWDILVNKNVWERHVALITGWYKNGQVVVLDYVEKNTISSYRKHWFYDGIFVVDRECIMRK